jgi:hypothetical protein
MRGGDPTQAYLSGFLLGLDDPYTMRYSFDLEHAVLDNRPSRRAAGAYPATRTPGTSRRKLPGKQGREGVQECQPGIHPHGSTAIIPRPLLCSGPIPATWNL